MKNKRLWRHDSCDFCGTKENLTKDHILPQWFSLAMKNFGFRIRGSLIKLEVGKTFKYQTLCAKCNYEKGGTIDYSNPAVRSYLKQFCHNILDIIDIFERP